VIDEVFHLKNSVAKHRPAEEFAAIRSRIARTRERLEKTAWQLDAVRGAAKAAGYLRRWLPSIVTFAEHAVEGFEVPWTSNPVERLMGEVSKRCKNQWMRWTAEGLEAILQLRLVKYADPEYYQAFLDELLQRSTKTAINCDLSIESDQRQSLDRFATRPISWLFCKCDSLKGSPHHKHQSGSHHKWGITPGIIGIAGHTTRT